MLAPHKMMYLALGLSSPFMPLSSTLGLSLRITLALKDAVAFALGAADGVSAGAALAFLPPLPLPVVPLPLGVLLGEGCPLPPRLRGGRVGSLRPGAGNRSPRARAAECHPRLLRPPRPAHAGGAKPGELAGRRRTAGGRRRARIKCKWGAH